MKKSNAGKVAAGLGVAALAAGAAAAYYLTGEQGKKHRKQVKDWAKKAETELAKKISSMEKLSKAGYEQAAKEVMEKYKQAKNIDPVELAAFGRELKGHWNNISKSIEKFGNKKPAKRPSKAKKTPKSK